MSLKKFTGPSLSIRYALPGLMAFLILATVGLTGWQSYQSGVDSVESLAKRLNLEVSQRIEGRILSFVELPNIFHEMNKAAIISTGTNLDEFDTMRKLFWDEVYISKSAPYLYYGTDEGYFLGIDTSYKGGQAVFKTRNAETEPDRVTYALSPEGEV